jgi:hypothetical protein
VYQSAPLGIETPSLDANSVIVYKKENTININSGQMNMKNVQVFDVRGRLVFDKKEVNANLFSANLYVENQILIVKITSDNGEIVSKKIVF